MKVANDGATTYYVGAERDAGVFFILIGEDKGKIVPFTKIAGGGSTDAGLGMETGRVDIWGVAPGEFKKEFLFGLRHKNWLNLGFPFKLINAGASFSYGKIDTEIYITTMAVSGGIGVSPLPFILQPGYNYGEIIPW